MTTDCVGGVWTYAVELIRELTPEVTFALATMGPAPDPRQRREAESLGAELFVGPYRLEWMQSPWEDVERAGPWLLDIEKRFSPDIIHLNGYSHGALPWRAPVMVVGHSCVLSWWEAARGEAAPMSAWWEYHSWVTTGLRAADLVVAPSLDMQAALQRHYGPLPSTQVIYNGRDPGRFRPAAKEPIILAAGRLWDPAKNISALARAARGLSWKVYVAGDERSPDGAGHLSDAVVPLGALGEEELASWMGRSSIYALPARYEPFGLSVLEAGLSGSALVLGDIPSLREIWADAAVFVDPDDPESLRIALASLIDSPGRRAELGSAARGRAGQFSSRQMARNYLRAYSDLLAARGSQALPALPADSMPLAPPMTLVADHPGAFLS